MFTRSNNASRPVWLLVFVLIMLLLATLSCSEDPITGIQLEDQEDDDGQEDETPPQGDGTAGLFQSYSAFCV